MLMEGARRDRGFKKIDSHANDNISNDGPGDESPIATVDAVARLCPLLQQEQRRLSVDEPEALHRKQSPADAGGPPLQPPEVDVPPTEANKQNTLVRKLANANSRWEHYCRKQAEDHAAYARSLNQRVEELERLLSDSLAAEQRLRDEAERQRTDALRNQLAAEEFHAVLLAQLVSTGANPWIPTTAATDEEEEERPDAGRSATASSQQQNSQQQHESQTTEEATSRCTDAREPTHSEGDDVEIAQLPPAVVESATSSAVGLCDDQLTPLLRLQIVTLEEDFAHERRDKESERRKGVAARQRCGELVQENSLLRQKLSAAESDLDRIRKERRQLRKTVEQLRQATIAAAPAASPVGSSRRPCAITAAPQSHAAADWWMKISTASKFAAAGCCGVMSACTTSGSGGALHRCIVFGGAATPSASATAAECGTWMVRCR